MFLVKRLNIAKTSILPRLTPSRTHLRFVSIPVGVSCPRQQVPANQSYPPNCGRALYQATQRNSSPRRGAAIPHSPVRFETQLGATFVCSLDNRLQP